MFLGKGGYFVLFGRLTACAPIRLTQLLLVQSPLTPISSGGATCWGSLILSTTANTFEKASIGAQLSVAQGK